MGKWDDDIPLRPVGSVQPSSVRALLRKLDLSTAPDSEKAAAIKLWLSSNEPNETMVLSLHMAGFSKLLAEASEPRRSDHARDRSRGRAAG